MAPPPERRNLAAIHLGLRLRAASCNPPGRRAWKPAGRLRARVVPIRSCSRWGLPCRPCRHVRGGLLPHPFTLTPQSGAVCFLWHFPWGRPRRTLSGTVFPWSPDFPRPAAFRHLRGAAARPTGRGSLNDRRSERQRNRRCRPVRRLLNDTRPRNPSRTRPPRAGRPPPAPRRACRSRRSSWQPGRCRR